MEFSFEANMDYYPEFYAFNLVGDHNYRASIMIVPRDVNHKTVDAQYQSTYDLIHKRLHEIAERNDIDIEISKKRIKRCNYWMLWTASMSVLMYLSVLLAQILAMSLWS